MHSKRQIPQISTSNKQGKSDYSQNPLISIIIPAYNEEKVLDSCLSSLNNQTYKNFEIIIVDDGSTDRTKEIAKKQKVKLICQNHKGPGPARNLGAKSAEGEILVFVDSDMTFNNRFIEDLTRPIIKREAIGTFSKNEINANPQNIWSSCWNLSRGLPIDRLIPEDYPDVAPVFRAILKKEFNKIGGFDATGEYTDDWSLSRKLGQKSTLAKGAVYYHTNPSSFNEYWKQARWYGKNEFVSGTFLRKIKSLIKYNPLFSLSIGFYRSIKNSLLSFIFLKLIFDFAVWISVIRSFTKEARYK